MAEAKESPAAAPAEGGGSNKLMMGLLGLNMVVMIAVAVVLFLGQKKQAASPDLAQVAQGAGAEAPHAEGHGEAKSEGHGGGGHGEAKGGGHGEAKGGEGGGGDSNFFSVGDFTANLSGPASEHYVKITVNFEMSKDADEEELKQRKPQFRDRIISLLNSKKPADLQSGEGRNSLKEEIKNVSNTFMKKGKVEGVYFSQFVVN